MGVCVFLLKNYSLIKVAVSGITPQYCVSVIAQVQLYFLSFCSLLLRNIKKIPRRPFENKYCSIIITSRDGIIAKCDVILDQSECVQLYNHLSNYTKENQYEVLYCVFFCLQIWGWDTLLHASLSRLPHKRVMVYNGTLEPSDGAFIQYHGNISMKTFILFLFCLSF